LLSSLVHCILYEKAKGVSSRDEANDGCSEDQIVSSTEDMLHSLVERMVKCEPEDLELVISVVKLAYSVCLLG